jgi:hypothetical protein
MRGDCSKNRVCEANNTFMLNLVFWDCVFLYTYYPPKILKNQNRGRDLFNNANKGLCKQQKMKLFSVKKAWSVRVGALELGGNFPGGAIETPALLISTRKGLPHFIPPDLLPSLPSPDSHLLQVSPLHL